MPTEEIRMLSLILLEHARYCENCRMIFSRADSLTGDCPACQSSATCWLQDLFAQARTEAIQQAVAVPYKPLWMRP